MTSLSSPEPAAESAEQNQTGSSLKRKRPPSLQIPTVLRQITSDATSTPRFGSEQNDIFRFSRPGVGLVSIKGKKKFMEDAHTIAVSSSCGDIKNFFGVYDGHGGCKAVDFTADNLHRNIMDQLKNCEGNEAKEEAVSAGYLKTDEDFLKQGLGSGVCCVTALIEGDKLVISNVGDCRAVISIDGVAKAVTKDHRAGDEDERKRIENNGGYLVFHRGAWRVHGILAVSRSIGDGHLKDWVLSEPDTKTLTLTPDKDYLVLASDGLWEEVGNQEAIDIVRSSCLTNTSMKLEFDANSDNDNNNNANEEKNFAPSTTLRKVLLVKKRKSNIKRGSLCFQFEEDKENEGFEVEGCDMETNNLPPPSKFRKIENINNKCSFHRNNITKMVVSNGVLNACNQLVNLAVERGSFDDITVMAIFNGTAGVEKEPSTILSNINLFAA